PPGGRRPDRCAAAPDRSRAARPSRAGPGPTAPVRTGPAPAEACTSDLGDLRPARQRVLRSGPALVQAGAYTANVQRYLLQQRHRAGAAHHDQPRDQGLEAARGLGIAERLTGEDRAEEPAPSVDADEPCRAVAGAAVG